MKLVMTLLMLFALVGSTAATTMWHNRLAATPHWSLCSVRPTGQETDKLVYADFESLKENRPVSARGGMVQLFGYQENPTLKSRFKGIGDSNSPERVRVSKESPNHAVTFEYELPAPNQYAGVTLEVQGQPEQEGKLTPDDVSRFKYLTVQLYVTGVTSINAEFLSRGHGIQIGNGHPRMSFQVKSGFNTYRIPLGSLSQPSWADVKVDPKDVLKKLTSVNLSVSCNQCVPTKGTVVVDNLIFQN